MHHRFFLVHQMDKVKVVAAIARGGGPHAHVLSDQAGRRQGWWSSRCASGQGRSDPRRSASGARERALADFSDGKLPVLVATDVAARGIHVDGVDVVMHYDPPEDHKAYIHRSGRTARAGEAGVAVMLSLWNEENEVRVIQRRLQLDEPIVEVFSNDPRLADLANWDPSA